MSRLGRALDALRAELPSTRRAQWEADRLLALESELELLREENARLMAEQGRAPDPTALAESLRAIAVAGMNGVAAGASEPATEDDAWDALARTAALREGLLAVCIELEHAAVRARSGLEEVGVFLDDSGRSS